MKRLLLPALLLAAPLGAAERLLTLREAYDLSLKRSETIAAQAASADDARAQVDELASAVKPHIFLRGSQLFREEPPSTTRSDPGPRNLPEARVTLEQPLFSGFRDVAIIKAGGATARAARADVIRAEHRLYIDVARAFYDLARLQKESATRDTLLQLTRDRLQEIIGRERLGRSRKSEVLSVETVLAGLEADRAQEDYLERQSQRVLAFLTGLEESVRPVELKPPLLPPLEEALARTATRPDVAARRERMDAARQSLSAARREIFPTVGLDGNYYLERKGASENIDWDVLVSAELPLYLGGGRVARQNQARAQLEIARQSYDLSVRVAALEVKASHDRLATTSALLPVLERAVKLAEANAKAQAADYRLGLVTNLEVLAGLQSLQESRLRLEEGRLEALLAQAELSVASGALP